MFPFHASAGSLCQLVVCGKTLLLNALTANHSSALLLSCTWAVAPRNCQLFLFCVVFCPCEAHPIAPNAQCQCLCQDRLPPSLSPPPVTPRQHDAPGSRCCANNRCKHQPAPFNPCSLSRPQTSIHRTMPPPLLDIDANPRQAGFRSTPPSKIPSPPKAQRDRRSPFSASTAGSPRYTAMSVSSKTTVTPKTSKIPRRSTPTLVTPPSGNTKSRNSSAQYQRLPSSNAMRKSPTTSSSLNSVRTPRHCFSNITADRVGTKEALPPVEPQ
jgi:hypothetical protein